MDPPVREESTLVQRSTAKPAGVCVFQPLPLMTCGVVAMHTVLGANEHAELAPLLLEAPITSPTGFTTSFACPLTPENGPILTLQAFCQAA